MTDLKSLFDGYSSSVKSKDPDSFLALYDHDVRVFDLWETWIYDGIDSLRAMVTGWFGSLGDESVVVEFEKTHINVSGDMGFATAFVTYKAFSKKGEILRSLQNRLTWVAQKKAGAWKIVHEHTSAPVDPQTGKANFKR